MDRLPREKHRGDDAQVHPFTVQVPDKAIQLSGFHYLSLPRLGACKVAGREGCWVTSMFTSQFHKLFEEPGPGGWERNQSDPAGHSHHFYPACLTTHLSLSSYPTIPSIFMLTRSGLLGTDYMTFSETPLAQCRETGPYTTDQRGTEIPALLLLTSSSQTANTQEQNPSFHCRATI